VVDLLPSVALGALLSYLWAILGMQFFAGSLSVDSGYPGERLSFDDFGSAVLVLTQTAVGGWSRILLLGIPSSYDDAQAAEAAAQGRVEPLPATVPLATWFLIVYRLLVISMMLCSSFASPPPPVGGVVVFWRSHLQFM